MKFIRPFRACNRWGGQCVFKRSLTDNQWYIKNLSLIIPTTKRKFPKYFFQCLQVKADLRLSLQAFLSICGEIVNMGNRGTLSPKVLHGLHTVAAMVDSALICGCFSYEFSFYCKNEKTAAGCMICHNKLFWHFAVQLYRHGQQWQRCRGWCCANFCMMFASGRENKRSA